MDPFLSKDFQTQELSAIVMVSVYDTDGQEAKIDIMGEPLKVVFKVEPPDKKQISLNKTMTLFK